jgi:hypothetical protein
VLRHWIDVEDIHGVDPQMVAPRRAVGHRFVTPKLFPSKVIDAPPVTGELGIVVKRETTGASYENDSRKVPTEVEMVSVVFSSNPVP